MIITVLSYLKQLDERIEALETQLQRMRERPYASYCGEADGIGDQLDELRAERAAIIGGSEGA
jgi:hypothetical protein